MDKNQYKNQYQIAAIREDLKDLSSGRIDIYSEPIVGFKAVINVMNHLRNRLIEKGFRCSVIFKQTNSFSAEKDGKKVVFHPYKDIPSVKPITKTEDWMEGLDPEDICKSIEMMKKDFIDEDGIGKKLNQYLQS